MRLFRRIAPYLAILLLAFALTVGILSTGWGSDILLRFSKELSFRSDGGKVSQLASTDPCPADAAADLDCWDGYYKTLLEKYGSHVALFELKTRYARGGYPRLFCHTLLHPIGEKAGEEYGNVADAYAVGDPFCRSGYYHGVLEGIFGEDGSGKLLTQLDTLCAQVKGKEKYSYDYFACVHGVGHGLMAYFDHDLFQSLSGCDKLSGQWEQSSCYGGVFMENVISDSEDSPSKFLKRDDAVYPCNAVDDTYRYQCYLMQTSHMLTVYDGDFGKVFDACSTVEEKYRVPCYQSLGRDASGWSYGVADDARAYCAFGRTNEQKAQCLAGAAVDFIQSSGTDAARQLCEKGDTEVRRACSDAVEYQLGSL
ncbi:hypothetical protein A2765_02495 [Candidatus Kaiserbacteria bacterium RIFCSPHIGHO2_01_FULL_56_24]|uniref:Uncharacterized protein n=1 Tax=Candidatus Kaiserbacteria bacterium RIFCSPHIGHO2_01_FULL_56_24 TaxID=1798487 RepID=A0A1F6DB56_9BACT|nr:MAG: hypothetical protein A2765_02495 [Candidatus Kaiserbacteria bacterium RIFCSPHIGHO2_01_FULL_56_24]